MNKEELERLFLINTNIKARIYDFSLIEDIILLSVVRSNDTGNIGFLRK